MTRNLFKMKKQLHSNFAYLGLAAALCISSIAAADEYYTPVPKDSVTYNECSACHLAYSPEMLPKASWEKIMSNLQDHFGEDASLDAKTQDDISRYLTGHAADNGWFGNKFTRNLDNNTIITRITETPYWKREHRRFSDDTWSSTKVKSKSNCTACHIDAERGGYDDD